MVNLFVWIVCCVVCLCYAVLVGWFWFSYILFVCVACLVWWDSLCMVCLLLACLDFVWVGLLLWFIVVGCDLIRGLAGFLFVFWLGCGFVAFAFYIVEFWCLLFGWLYVFAIVLLIVLLYSIWCYTRYIAFCFYWLNVWLGILVTIVSCWFVYGVRLGFVLVCWLLYFWSLCLLVISLGY